LFINSGREESRHMDTGNMLSAQGTNLPMSFKPRKDAVHDSDEDGRGSAHHSIKDEVSKGDSSFMDSLKDTGRSVGKWIKTHIIGEEADYQTSCKMAKMVALGATGGGALGAAAGYTYGLINENSNKVNEVWKTHDVNDPVKLLGWSHRDVEDGHTESHTYYTYETVSHTSYDSDGRSYTYYTSELQSHTYYTYEHDGYWHRNTPNIDWTKIGEFKTPALEREKAIGPIEGAAIGLGAGIIGGTIISALSAHIFKIARQLKEVGG